MSGLVTNIPFTFQDVGSVHRAFLNGNAPARHVRAKMAHRA